MYSRCGVMFEGTLVAKLGKSCQWVVVYGQKVVMDLDKAQSLARWSMEPTWFSSSAALR